MNIKLSIAKKLLGIFNKNKPEADISRYRIWDNSSNDSVAGIYASKNEAENAIEKIGIKKEDCEIITVEETLQRLWMKASLLSRGWGD